MIKKFTYCLLFLSLVGTLFAAFINTEAVMWDFPTTYTNGTAIPAGILATTEVALTTTDMDLNGAGAYIVKKVVLTPGNKLNLSDLFPSNKPTGNYHIWLRLTTTNTNIVPSVWTKFGDVFLDRLVLGNVPNVRIVPR